MPKGVGYSSNLSSKNRFAKGKVRLNKFMDYMRKKLKPARDAVKNVGFRSKEANKAKKMNQSIIFFRGKRK